MEVVPGVSAFFVHFVFFVCNSNGFIEFAVFFFLPSLFNMPLVYVM